MTGSSDEYEVSDADPDAGSNSDCDGESDYNPRASGSTSRAQASQSQSQKGRAATSAGGGMGKAKSGKAGTKTKTKKSRPAPNEFRIQGALKAYRTSTYTTSSLVDMIRTAQIDLDPEYQRDVVWVDNKQIGLIDSIFRNYYLPPIIFAVASHDDGTVLRTCIDGKQRLSSLKAFMDGKIYHRDIYTAKKWWYTPVPRGKQGARLPDRFRALFDKKQVVCVEYEELKGEEEREIFKRVQLGVALEPAERLQAIASPAASLVRSALTTYITPSSAPGSTVAPEDDYPRIRWDTARGAGFKAISHALFALGRLEESSNTTAGGDVMSVPFASVQQLDRLLSSSDVVPEGVRASFERAFRVLRAVERHEALKKMAFDSLGEEMDRVTKGKGKTKAAKESGKAPALAPIEFIATLVLFATHSAGPTTLSLEEMARGVQGMRARVRAKNKDIFSRAGVWRDLMECVAGLGPGGEHGLKKGKGREHMEKESTGGTMVEVEASERAWDLRVGRGRNGPEEGEEEASMDGGQEEMEQEEEDEEDEEDEEEPIPQPKKLGRPRKDASSLYSTTHASQKVTTSTGRRKGKQAQTHDNDGYGEAPGAGQDSDEVARVLQDDDMELDELTPVVEPSASVTESFRVKGSHGGPRIKNTARRSTGGPAKRVSLDALRRVDVNADQDQDVRMDVETSEDENMPLVLSTRSRTVSAQTSVPTLQSQAQSQSQPQRQPQQQPQAEVISAGSKRKAPPSVEERSPSIEIIEPPPGYQSKSMRTESQSFVSPSSAVGGSSEGHGYRIGLGSSIERGPPHSAVLRPARFSSSSSSSTPNPGFSTPPSVSAAPKSGLNAQPPWTQPLPSTSRFPGSTFSSASDLTNLFASTSTSTDDFFARARAEQEDVKPVIVKTEPVDGFPSFRSRSARLPPLPQIPTFGRPATSQTPTNGSGSAVQALFSLGRGEAQPAPSLSTPPAVPIAAPQATPQPPPPPASTLTNGVSQWFSYPPPPLPSAPGTIYSHPQSFSPALPPPPTPMIGSDSTTTSPKFPSSFSYEHGYGQSQGYDNRHEPGRGHGQSHLFTHPQSHPVLGPSEPPHFGRAPPTSPRRRIPSSFSLTEEAEIKPDVAQIDREYQHNLDRERDIERRRYSETEREREEREEKERSDRRRDAQREEYYAKREALRAEYGRPRDGSREGAGRSIDSGSGRSHGRGDERRSGHGRERGRGRSRSRSRTRSASRSRDRHRDFDRQAHRDHPRDHERKYHHRDSDDYVREGGHREKSRMRRSPGSDYHERDRDGRQDGRSRDHR